MALPFFGSVHSASASGVKFVARGNPAEAISFAFTITLRFAVCGAVKSASVESARALQEFASRSIARNVLQCSWPFAASQFSG